MALPSLYDLAFADDATAEEQARALAAALRGQRGGGMLGMATGDKYLAGLGQQMVQGANQQEAGLADMASTRLQRALERQRMAQQQAQHVDEMALRQAQIGETARHDRAVETISADRPSASPLQIVVGDGGRQFYVDPRNPRAPALPVLDQEGQPITKPQTQRPLQTGDKAILDDLTGEIQAVDALGGRFKDAFAGGGPAGQMATAFYQRIGSAGSKGMQEDAAFWADFSRLLDLPQRNKVFGASLSEGERNSWESAKNIRPGTAPALVRAKLGEMGQILRRKLTNIGDSLSEEGYDHEAIVKRTGGVYAGAPQTAPEPAPKRIKVDTQGNIIGG